MEKTQPSPGSGSSRSSSRATSAGSSPSSGAGVRRVSAGRLQAVAVRLNGGVPGTGEGPPGIGGSSSAGTREQHHKQQPLEGVLSKYTNLLQGWQNRYFLLDFESGVLQYFVTEASKSQKPRGSLPLAGSCITLGDEVPNMLVVSSASGEMYKLRATDAKERQFWVAQLQACAKFHTDSPKVMSQVEGQQKTLTQTIESLPGNGPLSALDQDLLLLKATSAATLSCLGECLNLLQQSMYQVGQQNKTVTSESILGWPGPKSQSPEHLRNGGITSLPSTTSANINWAAVPTSPQDDQTLRAALKLSQSSPPEQISSCDEMTDQEDSEEEDLGVMDEQRSVILHLISQLKLGMDLTRVVLPTFILEKRSLLEMYANFLSHPDLFLSISGGVTPEDRIIRFVEYYLTAFHEGRKGAIAKKPYNPLIGETFHCCWDVPKAKVKPFRTTGSSTAPTDQAMPQAPGLGLDETESYKLRFVAEQVSHHPPISCFYCECKERRMCVNTHIWTKSKFLGMSIGVSMVGEGVLKLLDHGEEYVFTLPSAYARSILTIPWVELGGKVNITCAKSGYSATVTFHTKPFYGGKIHRVTAEVKHNPTSTIVCKAQGEWNGTLEFTYSNGETKVVDTTKLPVIKKRLRPLDKQGPFESRNLWQHVTNSLKAGDLQLATQHKQRLEERQRVEAKQRAALNAPWKPTYFTKEGDAWIYFNPLWKTQ
ncbi:oxysterol-binding protein-related protein 10 isoform X3 [Ambystoma mexicanum]|uniref:oxysterol-binding protein-related protein 10 isoform X3 n=1 Tax=Ambystoma mexicanum TaxID=8296 RepID=UPI0037E9C138